jgi:putative acetyltransferase
MQSNVFTVAHTFIGYHLMHTLRKFKKSDIDQIIEIWLDASITAHDFIGREFWQAKVKDMRGIYIPAAETYVFEESGTIKGFFSLYRDTLAALFVSPSWQGTGIGNALMQKAKEMSDRLELTVYKQNVKSIGFYKKRGFVIEKEQIDKHTGHPEYVMRWTSTGSM